MNVIGEGATIDGAAMVLEYLMKEPENCIDSYEEKLNDFLLTALDALNLVKQMPRSPFAFVNEKGKYEEDIDILYNLNKSIDSLYNISANTIDMSEQIQSECTNIAMKLEEERMRMFSDLINWDEIYRYFKSKETEK
ncbi:MAG: hypothetical protein RSC84_03450 [Peptostreptococcaceae bacterium]